MKTKNLFLVVSKKWYDKIASGRKRVEYRAYTVYWRKRIMPSALKGLYKTVEFQCGYSHKYPRLKFNVSYVGLMRTPQEVADTVKTDDCFVIFFE